MHDYFDANDRKNLQRRDFYQQRPMSRACFKCHKEGHMAKECPSQQEKWKPFEKQPFERNSHTMTKSWDKPWLKQAQNMYGQSSFKCADRPAYSGARFGFVDKPFDRSKGDGCRSVQYAEPVMEYFSSLFKSDIPLQDVDSQLKVWTCQLLENALESQAKKVEVRFIKMGMEGFDVIDDGLGIEESEFERLCKTLPNRERNELYKTRSLGYMGETLNSLCMCSTVTIFTRH
jgi:hypothetical protein